LQKQAASRASPARSPLHKQNFGHDITNRQGATQPKRVPTTTITLETKPKQPQKGLKPQCKIIGKDTDEIKAEDISTDSEKVVMPKPMAFTNREGRN